MLKELFKNIQEPFQSDTIFIIKTYMAAGYECILVGGPLRDLLLGLQPKDMDFATNCPMSVTKELFKSVVPTGEDHGTLSIILNSEPYEVTQYRSDVSCDGRNATVEFSDSFDIDAWRRDLTVNAMGYNPITDELFDPTNGMDDFNNHLLRFVGKAEDRIREDHLRSIRFIRFMAKMDKFGFTSDRENLEAAINTYDHTVVSVERIYQELDGMFKILKENDYSKSFVKHSLHDMRIFKRFIIDDKIHEQVINEIFETYDYLPLLIEMKGDIQSLKLSSEYKELHSLFITFQDGFEEKDFSDQTTVKALLRLTDGNFDTAERVLNYFNHFNKENNHKDGLITLKALKNKVGTVDEEPYKVTQLKVNGNDLMQLGFKGPEIGMQLNVLLKMVVDRPELNDKEKLLKVLNNDN